MSKKKASMSLKDFHGGVIPSDLSLPSAPGVFVRSTNLSGFDRPGSRGGSVGRPDQWVRPNSAPAARRFDDKTPFLGPSVPIGRHFDEDERKPLDGSPTPRRTVNDESSRVPPIRVEVKPEPALGGRMSGSGGGPHAVNSYLGRVVDGGNSGLGSQSVTGSGAQVRGPANAWGVRKDPVVSIDELGQSSWSGRSVESKLAHASALDKVLSGKWQTKQSLPYQTDAEVIDHPGVEKVVGSRVNDEQKNPKVSGKESDIMLARQLERGMAIGEGKLAPGREFVDHDGARASSYGQMKERNLPLHLEKVQPAHIDGRLGGRPVSPLMQSEPFERPKLKLLPRTKPLESTEMLVPNHKQGYSGQIDSPPGHMANTQELPVNVKPGVAGDESENQVVERPKLNLKPRSQPVELAEGRSERERTSLFGGARPREMVLKHRGVDDTDMNNHELSPQADRVKHNVVKHNVPKTEKMAQHAITTHPGERVADSPHTSPRIGKKSERKDQPTDNERADMQGKNWRSENWRNNKDTEKQQQRQLVQRNRQQQPLVQRERQPSPETWRKPVEPQKPTNHFGKTASAVELAQAFSRSISDPRAADPYSGHKILPGTNQMPFSRLMGPGPRPQINGY